MTHPIRAAAVRPPGLRRGVAALVATPLAVAASSVLAVSGADSAGYETRATQPVIVLKQGHVARSRPNAHAPRIEYVAPLRPLTGVRTVLPALGRSKSGAWVRVRLPGRPNGHAGWIRTAHTRRTSTPWRLTLDLSARQLTVRYHGQVRRGFRAVIGASWTPTPSGRFFVEESVALPGHAGGPFALATSARSNVLQEFEGGPGQIAVHGTDGLAGALGSAASHGCVRLGTSAITWLARRIGAGVPMSIQT